MWPWLESWSSWGIFQQVLDYMTPEYGVPCFFIHVVPTVPVCSCSSAGSLVWEAQLHLMLFAWILRKWSGILTLDVILTNLVIAVTRRPVFGVLCQVQLIQHGHGGMLKIVVWSHFTADNWIWLTLSVTFWLHSWLLNWAYILISLQCWLLNVFACNWMSEWSVEWTCW